ncbi:hypothetical protein JR316_0012880 [Psilocybe cubensis]|uniref:Uncharacterized protein n=2 Tax=Psilocybe cubensis TaxID=181762 RepID=A0ACB8GFU7_PSICU|nr:hypothetical protein JR316_0012880 [Psilocybe cubensis]KAH9474421.1 hypothetical protein JR316_0012880 [Psilocybe cubensis]
MSSLFASIGKALKAGTLRERSSDKDTIVQLFEDANKKLEKYIEKYRVSLNKWWTNKVEGISSFPVATEMDQRAIDYMKKYREVLEEQISKLKNEPTVTLDIFIWGETPFSFDNTTKKFNDQRTQIEPGKIIEYTVLHRRSRTKDRVLSSFSLELYPQFYTKVPVNAEGFGNGTRTIPSIIPWEPVSICKNKPLNIIVNRSRTAELKEFYIVTPEGQQVSVPKLYSNAWVLQGPMESPRSFAVRRRTVSNSLAMWKGISFPIAEPYDPSSDHDSIMSDSTQTGSEYLASIRYQENLAESNLTLVGPTNRVPSNTAPDANPPLPSEPRPNATKQSISPVVEPNNPQSLVKSTETADNNLGSSGNADIQEPIEDGQEEGTSQVELLPGWKSTKLRRPVDDATTRVGVATPEKAKSKKWYQRLFGR